MDCPRPLNLCQTAILFASQFSSETNTRIHTMSTSASASHGACPLLRLPSELRNRIWELVVANEQWPQVHGDPILPTAWGSLREIKYSGLPEHISLQLCVHNNRLSFYGIDALPLIFANKQIFDEVMSIVWPKVYLCFETFSFGELEMRSIPRIQQSVRNIVVDFCMAPYLHHLVRDPKTGLQCQEELVRYLDGFRAGCRLYILLGHGSLIALQKKDPLFEPLAAFLESGGLRDSPDHWRECTGCGSKWTVEYLKGADNSWSEVACTLQVDVWGDGRKKAVSQ